MSYVVDPGKVLRKFCKLLTELDDPQIILQDFDAPDHLKQTMIALYNFVPLYCPSCSSPTRLDRIDNILTGKFEAHQALSCTICGVMFQLADKTDLLRAATASGGDMVEYYIDDQQEDAQTSLN